ncbi:plant UBX domain-containing protein 1 [Ziziphus jujuba]|uniref:Plant UBX domain-containing protein 1 n=1 Tax=Ziziphus jujuba TaxID=326968 RepID=A0A6P4BHB4_ZIZJJ|nr:plant UBX domain-containing protein 1 [Ziziphus jujuba]
MTVDWSATVALKRRRFTNIHPMDAQKVKAKLAAAKVKFGREIHVFETSSPPSSYSQPYEYEEKDDLYEFTAEDYYRLLSLSTSKKKEDNFLLKTRKIREAEEAARRSKITRATIRVRFPDNHTLEATFHPSETIQSLVDLLKKAIARPDLPFYVYTTPPKEKIKDMSQDFYSAGFAPGAILYFAYDIPPKGDHTALPFLQEEIMCLKGLEFIVEHQGSVQYSQPVPEPCTTQAPTLVVQERKPAAEKKLTKPKWLKL